MKKHFLFALLFGLVLMQSAFAGKERMSSRINSGNIVVGAPIAVSDNKFPNINLGGTALVLNSTGKLTLGLDNYAGSLNYFAMNNFYLKVGVQVAYATTAGPTLYQTVDLVIDYSKANPSLEKSISVFKNAHVLSAYIVYFKDASNNIITSPFIPSNLYLEAEIETDRIYTLTTSSVPVINHYYDASSNELEVYWNSITGAEEYELEWTYVNNFDATSSSYEYNGVTVNPAVINSIPSSNLEFTFLNNATRIRTSKNNFRIGLNYDQGMIVYRIRAISKDITNPSFEKVGDWTVIQPNTTPALQLGSLSSGFDDYYVITAGHETNKNWQITSTYAEDGKKKEVVGYFDGSLRKRQTVTKTNTENIAIVGETMYDSQGRPAVQILPSPSQTSSPPFNYSSEVKYYENFNQSKNQPLIGGFHVPYGKADFENPSSCPPSPGPLFTGAPSTGANGASLYYSPNNQNKENQQAYVPNAQEFPLTSSIYLPDNTGRIKYQSGVGPDHKIGSGHETKYLYGDPDQEDLDKLFGSEAGYKERYKKNMVIDPNGQISVSYLNTEDKVVATALAGNTPGNVNSLNSTVVQTKNVSYLDYSDPNYTDVNVVENGALVFKKKIIPDVTGTYSFFYDLTVPQFTDNCISAFCYDCVYDLDIEIVDECGNPVYTKTATVGSIGGSVDFTCGSPIYFSSTGWTPAFATTLNAGKEYFLTKTLTINSKAIDDYLKHYIDSLNNTCVKTLFDFQTTALANVDYTGCHITCAQCSTQVEAYYLLHSDPTKTVSTNSNYDPDYIYMSPEQKQLAIDECMGPCKPATLCQVQFDNMLQDLRPMGQYAQYDVLSTGVYDPTPYELSIFYWDNYLRINTIFNNSVGNTAGNPFGVNYDMTQKAYWRNPEFYNKNAHNFSAPAPSTALGSKHYFNPDGTISKLRLVQTSPGVYYPTIISAAPVFTDGIGEWTYPENLATLKDFVQAYANNPYWAYSLVKNHPEFNYFLDCDRQSNPVFSQTFGTQKFSSEDFDSDLRLTSTFALATAPTSTTKHWTIQGNTNQSGDNSPTPGLPDLIDYDPYFMSPGAGASLKSTMLSRLTNYQGTGKTIKQIAAEMYSTANMFYSGCNGTFGASSIVCASVTYPIPTGSLDEQWKAYRDLYLAEKQKLLNERAHVTACQNPGGVGSDYYNGAIGDANFNPFQSSISYGYNIFLPSFSFFFPPPFIVFTPGFWPTPSPTGGYPANFFYYPSFGKGYYDFGSPSSYFHKNRYSKKIKRFPDMQTLSNILAGGATDPSTMGANMTSTAENSIYFATGQCPIFKKLEFFLSATAKKGTLFNFTITNPLVVEPAFVQDLYDAVSTCGGYPAPPPGNWHPIGFQPNFSGQTITLKFYNMTTNLPYPTSSDITLTNLSTSTLLTPSTWNNIVAFTNIHYNGTSAGQSLFTIKALYNPGAGQPYIQLDFSGTTCIPNSCTPPPSQICKATQQAVDVQSFLSGVLADYASSSPAWVDLGLYTNNSAQYFTPLVRYPFSTAAVGTSPITHSVSFNTSSYNQITIQGQNPTYSGGITVTFNFAPTTANPGANLNGALGFTSITPNQGTGPYDFIIKALYPAGVTKLFEVTVVYSGGVCGNLNTDPCRKYVFGDCSPFVPAECNNDRYNTTMQLQSLLNEIKNYPLNTPIPLAGLSHYSSLLQGQIGVSASQFVSSVNSVYTPSTNVTSYTLAFNFQKTNTVTPTPTTVCSANLTFTASGTPVTVNLTTFTFSAIKILNPPSNQFAITASNGTFSVELIGTAPCLLMENCEPCSKLVTIFKEDFDSYNATNTTASSLNFDTEVLYVPPISTPSPCTYTGFNVCTSPVAGGGFGKFSVLNGNACTGFSDHTGSTTRNYLYSIFRVPVNAPFPPTPVDYMDVWKTKTGNNITTNIGTLYEISFYYRSHLDAGFNLDLIVDDGTSETVVATKVVFPTTNTWTLMKASWTATSSSIKLKVRTRPFQPPSSSSYSWFNYIAVDDILVQERQCENKSVYPLPPQPPVDDCHDQLMNIALSNAQQEYSIYIDNIKKDFVERYTKKCQESLERMQAQYTTTEGHYTLYYYDQGGNLIKTVPPEGVEPINLSATDPVTGLTYSVAIKNDRLNKTHTVFTKHRMATKYEYNSLNQLIRQQLPDHENMDNWNITNNLNIPSGSNVMNMDFANNLNGYMVGNDGSGNGVIYITNNGGATWSPASAVGLANVIDLDVSGSDAIGVLSDGTLLKSSNYTSPTPTWVSINLPGSSLMQFTDITFNGSTGYITGKNGLLLKSIDGGVTWNSLVIGTSANLNKTVLVPGGYGVIVGDNGTLFYLNPTLSGWTQFSMISPSINLTNATILSTGNSSTTYMELMVTGNDLSASPAKGTVINIKDVDNFSTVFINAVLSLTSTFNSSLGAITSNTYILGSSSYTDVYVGGVINAGPDAPVLYKLQSVSSSAYTPTSLSIAPVMNTAVTSLVVNNYGNSASEVHGTLKNGKFVYVNGSTINGYGLAGTGSALNANQLNNVWVDPSNIYSGIAVGNGGTIIKYSSANTTTLTSSSLNSITFQPLNSVTAAKDGSGKVYVVGDAGTALYSSNNGTSWQFISTGLTNNLYASYYIPGANKVAIGGNGGYLGTIDAVTNLAPATIDNPVNTTIYRNIIRNPNNNAELFVSGTPNGSNALIAKCTFASPNIPSPVTLSGGGAINKLVFVNNLTAFAAGDGGTIIKSVNGGLNFGSPAVLSSSSDLKDIVFTDQFSGYALGNSGTIHKTTDAGANWTQKPAPATGNINTAYNFGNGQLLAAGTGGPNLQNINDQSSDYSTRFLYDALGRLVVSQNSKQFNKPTKAYSYTIYDAIGRIAQVGEIAGGSLPDPFSLTTGNGIIDINVFNTWLAGGSKTEVTSTVYDVAVSTNPCGFTQDNLRKRVSATYLDTDDNLSNGYQHATYYTYDIHGNVNSLMQENPNMPTGNTCKRIDYQYDLISGKVNQVAYQDGQPDAYFHKYDYDSDNRITNVYTSKDGFNWQQDAKYFYYLHGPLARTEIGDDKVQGMDYAYTLQGWIKGINSTILNEANDIGKDGASGTVYNSTLSDLNKHISKDAASYSLNYFKDDYIAIDASKNTASNRFDADVTNNPHMSAANNWLYNGNISAMVTTIQDFTGGPPGTPAPQLSAYKYDQLNRINDIRTYKNIASNAWGSASAGNEYRNEFTYDANGNIMNQKRYNDAGTQVDDISYKYQTDGGGKKYANRLYHVNDVAAYTSLATNDIDDEGTFTPAPAAGNIMGTINTANNYGYDEIGNLTRDNSEKIANIEWTVYGKIKQITRASSSVNEYNHKFEYDATGNRIEKTIYKNGTPVNQWETTYYVRDAQGNVMATYEYKPVASVQTLYLVENPVYGSSRVGIQNYLEKDNLAPTSPYNTSGPVYAMNMKVGNKSYELSNHLGNVITVVSDKKIPVEGPPSSGIVSSYTAEIIAATDYYSFGMVKENRNYTSSTYRYGFNGKEKDNEIEGDGNTYDFESRMYNTRLGKWFTVDPLHVKYPEISSYAFVANDPILFVDRNGKEIIIHFLDENKQPQTIKYTAGMAANTGNAFADETINSLNTLHNGSPTAAGIIDKAIVTTYKVDVEYTNKDADRSYDPSTGVLEWSPVIGDKYSQPSSTGEMVQSPMITLAHELDHFVEHTKLKQAVEDAKTKAGANYENDPDYKTAAKKLDDYEKDPEKDEPTVVANETKIANDFKQGSRPSYDESGSKVITTGGTSTKKAENKDYEKKLNKENKEGAGKKPADSPKKSE